MYSRAFLQVPTDAGASGRVRLRELPTDSVVQMQECRQGCFPGDVPRTVMTMLTHIRMKEY